MIETLHATRYITPLREGGSLPAIVETGDGECYVMKFFGAGQGRRALIAELIAGEIARALGLRVPEIAFIHLDEAFGRSERHQEIQDLLRASVGLNLGLRFLPGAFAYSPMLKPPLDAQLASEIVWFDAYVTNVDRTARNVNMLLWENALWLIDHGAALYFHHDWTNYLERSRTPFAFIRQHTLLHLASELRETDERLKARLSPERLRAIVDLVPDAWLGDEPSFATRQEHRDAYYAYLESRLAASTVFIEEALRARAKLI